MVSPAAAPHPSRYAPPPPWRAALQHDSVGRRCIQPDGGIAQPERLAVLSSSGCTHKFVQQTDGTIRHVNSTLCLSPGESPQPGVPLRLLQSCDDAAVLAFYQAPRGAMVHAQTGMCLGLDGGATQAADGARVVLSRDCTQRFRFSAGPFPPAGALLVDCQGAVLRWHARQRNATEACPPLPHSNRLQTAAQKHILCELLQGPSHGVHWSRAALLRCGEYRGCSHCGSAGATAGNAAAAAACYTLDAVSCSVVCMPARAGSDRGAANQLGAVLLPGIPAPGWVGRRRLLRLHHIQRRHILAPGSHRPPAQCHREQVQQR